METLIALQVGRLTDEDFHDVAAHVETCASCLSALEELEQQHPPDSFVEGIREHMLAKDTEPSEGLDAFQKAIQGIGLSDEPVDDPVDAEGPDTATIRARATPGPNGRPANKAAHRAAGRAAEIESPLPDTIGPYKVLARLGVGGMGVVYKARQTPLQRIVALKMILGGAHADSAANARFRTEGTAIARLHHPGVVQIFDFGTHDNLAYFAMEYVEGGNLRARLDKGPLEIREAVELVHKLAEAVAYAHQQNVLHRDLKPTNILLTADGHPKIADFGLAKLLDADSGNTASEAILGTPAYMAPEQASAKSSELGRAVDIWTLGVILFETLTQVLPFHAKTRIESLGRVRTLDPAAPSRHRRQIPRDLDAICLKCLEKSPSRRYASAKDLADDLARYLRSEPIVARPPSLLRRTGRFLRRHVAAVCIAVFLAGSLGAVLAAQYVNDPDRPLRAVEAELRRTGSTTLIGETGEPRWFRWLSERGKSTASLSEDGVFTLHSMGDGCYLELLPSTFSDSYTLSAEVRHEKSGNPGHVGVFCMHSSLPTEKGPLHQMVKYYFNDVRSVADMAAELPNDRIPVESLTGARTNRARLVVEQYCERISTLGGSVGLGTGPRYPPTVSQGLPPAWRRLTVSVTPEAIVATWDGEQIPEITAARLEQSLFKANARLLKTDPGLSPVPANPQGAIGVYVARSSAAFRNVQLTSLRANRGPD